MAISRIKLPFVPNERGVVTLCTVSYGDSWWIIILRLVKSQLDRIFVK